VIYNPGEYIIVPDTNEISLNGVYGNQFRMKNYPNPFYESTTISYLLEKPAMVTITLYDTKGTQLVTLVNEFQTAGRQLIKVNKADFFPGIYFYNLSVDGVFAGIQKIVIN